MLSGIDLAYTGEKVLEFTKCNDQASISLKFRHIFKNVGAIVIRTQLGQAQRAILLQSICRDAYSENPANVPGEGGNQNDLFSVPEDATSTYRVTKSLEQIAHYTIGRGKVLNERTQPQKKHNTESLRGEEYLWDALHSPLWSIGLNLAGQLTRQGFLYICSPVGLNQSEYESITKELSCGAFKKINIGDTVIIVTASGVKLETAPISQLTISMDPEYKITKQKNGFVISNKGLQAPIGWMIHSGINDRLVEAQYTEDLLRVIRTAKGGAYLLSKAEFSLLVEQMRANTDRGRMTQNRILNLLEDVVQVFEREYKFEPMKLISATILTSYNTIQKRIKETDVLEDFLTGMLLSEMVQVLKETEKNSTRPKLPHLFSNSFDVINNTAKAFAYAYDFKKSNGSLAFVSATANPISSPDGELVDVRVNGSLQDPDLTNPKHTASLLATGILIAEQMLLEQLLRDAVLFGDDHLNALALQSMLNNSDTYIQLKAMAQKLPANAQGPILGLQIKACEPMIEVLRKSLSFDHLIDVTNQLYSGKQSCDVNDTALNNLFTIGKTLQKLQATSVIEQGSRGINAGVAPVIEALSPALYSRLVSAGDIQSSISATKITMLVSTQRHAENNSQNACPYLMRTNQQDHHQKNTWCNFFVRKVLPVAAVGLAVTAAVIGMRNE